MFCFRQAVAASASDDAMHARFNCRVFRLMCEASGARSWITVLEDSVRWLVDNSPAPPELEKRSLLHVANDELAKHIKEPRLGDTTWGQSALLAFNQCLDRVQHLLESVAESPAAAWGWPAKEWTEEASTDQWAYPDAIPFGWWKRENLEISRSALDRCRLAASSEQSLAPLDTKGACESLRAVLAINHSESKPLHGLSWGFPYELQQLQMQLYNLLHARLTSLKDISVVTTFVDNPPRHQLPQPFSRSLPGRWASTFSGPLLHNRFSILQAQDANSADLYPDFAGISSTDPTADPGLSGSIKTDQNVAESPAKALQASLCEEQYLTQQLISGMLGTANGTEDDKNGRKRLRDADYDELVGILDAERERELSVTQTIATLAIPGRH
mmetsp:Transcript_33865/g.95901  ORF Transcript_33865/g.95901 Transcript_33865/m.95901 type:complete len:386 (+) Transcript_33865:133-1290(+)